MQGEMLEFPNNTYGLALNLERDSVGAVILGNYEHISEGDVVKTTKRILSVPVGRALIGRVVNALGQPIDGKGPIQTEEYDVVEKVASEIFIPFSVGGGISTVQDMRAVLLAGAEKISVNSAAVKHPEIISQGADAFGSQAIVVGMDVKRVPVTPEIPSGYEIVIHGGRKAMGIDAIEWAKRCEALGAGELCVNSIDADGTKDGYELTLTRLICDAVRIPVIASGGAGSPQHMVDAVTEGRASAALIASIVHYGEYTIGQLKQYMADRGVPVRLTW